LGGLILAHYQRRAIDELILHSTDLIKGEKSVENNLIVFSSPTGSGKTVMLCKYIEELAEKESDIAFIWFSPGDGDLIDQSYRSVKKNISNKIRCTLVDGKKGRLEINNKEVFFINWEKINKKNNKLNRDGDLPTFKETINRAVDKGRKIVVIIDESHFKGGSAFADTFLESLNYDVKLGVSATPKVDSNIKVLVYRQEVVNEGFIKKSVVLNSGIQTNVLRDDVQDLDGFDYSESDFELLMSKAFDKRNEIKKAYIDEGYNINPLVLIQIPNGGNSKEIYKKAILEFLIERGISEDKLAWHFEGDKVRNTDLDDTNKQVEFFIFKQAIATGWDCPRSHILLRFRDVSSESFNIQTLGRVLRVVNPTKNKYISDLLNNAFMYTNSTSTVNDISKFDEGFTLEETDLKDKFFEFKLPSFGYEKLDKTEIDEMFILDKIQKHMYNNYSFADMSTRKEHNLNMLHSKGWDISEKSHTKILTEQVIEDIYDQIENSDTEKEYTNSGEELPFVTVKKTSKDLMMLNGQLVSNITNYLKIFSSVQVENILKKFVNSLLLGEENRRYRYLAFSYENRDRLKDLFLDVFSNLEDYSGVNKKIIEKEFRLPNSTLFKTSNFKSAGEYDLSVILRDSFAYNDYFIKKEDHKVLSEDTFVLNLQNHLSHIRKIKMWWKNLDSGSEGFSLKYEIDDFEQLTYPDFIIEFEDGTVGIFESKGEQEFSKWSKVKAETKAKMDAINEYVIRMNKEDRNRLYIGGVVASYQGRLRIYLHSEDRKGTEFNKYVMENFRINTEDNKFYPNVKIVEPVEIKKEVEEIKCEEKIEDVNLNNIFYDENKYTKLFKKVLKGSKKAMTIYEIYQFAKEYGFLITVGFPSEKVIHEWDWLIWQDVMSGRIQKKLIEGRNNYYIEGFTNHFPEKVENSKLTLKELVELVFECNSKDLSSKEIYYYVIENELDKDLISMDKVMLRSVITGSLERFYKNREVEIIENDLIWSFLELAIKVLYHANDKLTTSEIWEAAKNLGWLKYVEYSGRTPINTLSSRLLEAEREGKINREKIDGVYKYFL
jgi:type III restriction enzyme